MNQSPKVSVATPIYNERETIPALLERTLGVLDALPGGPHEMVFVDDGSSDGSHEMLCEAAAQDSRLTVVKFSRNFGHQAALGAALDHVTGDVIVLMDGDLQDAPEYIPEFINEYLLGHDVVYAERTKRKEPFWLRACYRAFYWLIARSADVSMPQGAGDFGLMSRRVVDTMRLSPERHRYWRGLRSWAGFRQVGVKVERDARFAGKSKYSLRKLVGLAFDGIFSFTVVPLRCASICGAAAVCLAMVFAAYSVFARLFLAQIPQGFTALIVAMVFLSGVQLLFLGIIGEYIGRIYEQVKLRPLYVIDRITRQSCSRTTPASTEICTSDTGGGGRANDSCSPPLIDISNGAAEISSMSDAATASSLIR